MSIDTFCYIAEQVCYTQNIRGVIERVLRVANRELQLVALVATVENHWSIQSGRGGARGLAREGYFLPKFFRSLSESPTQTIDSSPCCKTGPSSGSPKWKCLAPPLQSGSKAILYTV